MKKSILATVAVGGFLLAGGVVQADDLNGQSTAKIGLTTQDPDNPNGPIDPIDPDDDPASNLPTGNTGTLRIDYVSNMDFGTQTISGKTETYQAIKPVKMTEAQVSDLRGSGAGWHLQVSYDTTNPGFTSSNKVLKGAELTLPAGNTKSAADNQSALPNTAKVIINDNAQNIMSAETDTGLGTWADQMTTTDITLKVPSGNQAGDYTATLVWTLADAPA